MSASSGSSRLWEPKDGVLFEGHPHEVAHDAGALERPGGQVFDGIRLEIVQPDRAHLNEALGPAPAVAFGRCVGDPEQARDELGVLDVERADAGAPRVAGPAGALGELRERRRFLADHTGRRVADHDPEVRHDGRGRRHRGR